ncbi:hypothetical protein SCLCIDRAFT_923913 [Scleroderma citrinum Foug A]|uniref:Uncharacterized protein n=1 Tax=Scleroderma citrinum Foug A TaxID=1036808 RepID=A0A0C3DXJ4_9AGAM|nr:hypothetical protein SCLCIDRAFT_923913 [Scleroderma citrinum Foug A]
MRTIKVCSTHSSLRGRFNHHTDMEGDPPTSLTDFPVHDKFRVARTSIFDPTPIPENYPASIELPLYHSSDDAVSVYAHQQCGVGSFCENPGGSSPPFSQLRGLQQKYAWSSGTGEFSNPPSPKGGADAGTFI